MTLFLRTTDIQTLRETEGPDEADLRVTTGVVKDVGVALEDKDVVDRGDGGLF